MMEVGEEEEEKRKDEIEGKESKAGKDERIGK